MSNRSATSEVKLSLQSTIRNTLDNADTATATIAGTVLTGKLENGVSASQANRGWRTTSESISSGATQDIDLYDFAGFDIGAGAGNDALGLALNLEEIVTIIIKHRSGAGRLEIMPTPLPTHPVAWLPTLTVANGGALKTGGVFMMHQPDTDAFDIQDGVSHILRLKANGGAVLFDLYILGRHDDDESSSSSLSSSPSSQSTTSSQSSRSSSQSSLSTSSSSSETSVSSSSSTSETSTRSWSSATT
jgi:hypothetical protein